jgi:hypothetical protein
MERDPTDEEIRKVISDKFPFKYSGGGYFRKKGVPKGESAQVLHGEEAIKFIIKEILRNEP